MVVKAIRRGNTAPGSRRAFAPHAKDALEAAAALAATLGCPVDARHLLVGIAQPDSLGQRLLKLSKVDVVQATNDVKVDRVPLLH
ncbi:hypothetical protein [Ruania rhizosphaerae]|uniref:hypothetical protein n=1 Tax=Ruania rhizosphaerae TaxID=1840413 RepID=UPI001F434CED|nr:hypothetical protein [Ruania rhizosphaerae]